MWKTTDGKIAPVGKSFTMPMTVPVEKFQTVKMAKPLRVSLGFVDEVQNIRHPKSWANWADERKIAVGLTFEPDPVEGEIPASFNPLTGKLVAGDPVDGVIPLTVEGFPLETIRERYIARLNDLEYRYTKEAQIDLGGVAIPVDWNSSDYRAKGKRRIAGQVVTVTADIANAVLKHHEAAGLNAAMKQEAIDRARSKDDFGKIDLEAGWPPIYS